MESGKSELRTPGISLSREKEGQTNSLGEREFDAFLRNRSIPCVRKAVFVWKVIWGPWNLYDKIKIVLILLLRLINSIVITVKNYGKSENINAIKAYLS